MSIELWFALVAATAALLIVPGPVVIMLFNFTLTHGRSVSWAAIPGVVLGDFFAMTLSLAGAGALLMTSSTLFMLLKIFGAAYLIWLGISVWRTGLNSIQVVAGKKKKNRWLVFRQAFVVTALNPKDIVFFIAFLPQFIIADRPAVIQLFIIETTFLTLVVISTSLWIFIGSNLKTGLKSKKAQSILNRFGACSLIGAGAITAITR
ncbi:MAG: LysE family translocator [Sneathiella sp.]|nr:LysE family translocator [Sneathiella sp.]